MKQKSPGCNSNKRLYMPIIMQTQTLCSYILSTITIHTHVHSIALPHGKCSSHIQHLLQYLAHFPKQNKAANHIPYAYQKFPICYYFDERPCLRKRPFAFSQHAPTFQTTSHTSNTIQK